MAIPDDTDHNDIPRPVCTCEPMNGAFEIRDQGCPRHGEVVDYPDQVIPNRSDADADVPLINDVTLEYRRRLARVIDRFPYTSASMGPVDASEEDFLARLADWAESASESITAVQDTVREMQVELEQHRADRRALRRVFGLSR